MKQQSIMKSNLLAPLAPALLPPPLLVLALGGALLGSAGQLPFSFQKRKGFHIHPFSCDLEPVVEAHGPVMEVLLSSEASLDYLGMPLSSPVLKGVSPEGLLPFFVFS